MSVEIEKHEIFMFAVLLLRVIEQPIKIIKSEFFCKAI